MVLVVQKSDRLHSHGERLEQQNSNGRVGKVLSRLLRGGKHLGLGAELLVVQIRRRRAVNVL